MLPLVILADWSEHPEEICDRGREPDFPHLCQLVYFITGFQQNPFSQFLSEQTTPADRLKNIFVKNVHLISPRGGFARYKSAIDVGN